MAEPGGRRGYYRLDSSVMVQQWTKESPNATCLATLMIGSCDDSNLGGSCQGQSMQRVYMQYFFLFDGLDEIIYAWESNASH